uniref:DUF7332 family protein n=1 Tax=Halegenticoccus tardaugens TaxID=2071624 RepID=UPI00100A6582|nr:hypothetical protein [Halegenticoccus tardaugens]
MEARGTTGEHRIVSLDAGVLFAGVGDPARFLRYPFDRFALAFRYAFEVPTLPDVRYESDEVPVVGPVGTAAC